ncbi:hypothetical protein [Haloarcula salinisoli]|uniref:Uncharacterized protein n=1 Tax=Haloarcula salinisoli TaxID=2487746 RepID=A0A8J7YQ79_9EURY|nr:hypothetical protein [Halomicroarcula salinisoli]MBX0288404.1 hypothetical protein [Halomicroarcula salinisoli]MBX0305886.1 hypothetical protein [Halomicroarcula salinisoli]
MQIICKDGTTIQCEDFQATDSGVLFFQGAMEQAAEGGEEEEEEEEEERKADGFVPITELHFVLPDEMVQQAPQPTGAPEQGRAGGPPQGAPPQQGGGLAQQQQMQQPPRGPGQHGR